MLGKGYMSVVSRSRLNVWELPRPRNGVIAAMSHVPKPQCGFKLRSWVFDAGMEKDCALASVKDIVIGTCSSWMSKDDS